MKIFKSNLIEKDMVDAFNNNIIPCIKTSSINNNPMNNNPVNDIFDRVNSNRNKFQFNDSSLRKDIISPVSYSEGTLPEDNISNFAPINQGIVNSNTRTSSQPNNITGYTDSIKHYRVDGSMSDDVLVGDIGYSFMITDKLLGHGSYGDVFLATDEYGKQVAVKCCLIDDTGIPNILESSIMASTFHPYLNKSLRILASDTKLYIIQELAITDLAQYTRRDKGNHKPNIEELRKWCYCLSQAVRALHDENIIHADIKSSNILLYADGTIRLTDYTLATKKWSIGQKFKHNVCTCTHRPLECLMRRPWDESLDIWSLGCTFYEIAYGELLFSYQGLLDPDHKVKDKESKIRLRDRSINSIIDWSARGPNPPTSYEIIGTTQLPIDYIPPVLCEDYHKPEMSIFNDLMCKMLIVDPEQRLTIHQVISHPFFTGMSSPIYMSVRRPTNKIPMTEHARVSRYIQRYTNNKMIQALALNIYCRCNDMNHLSEHLRSAVCTWIASKLVTGEPPKITLSPDQILSTEREICHNLLFRLHCI